jgi:tripartite-type tricarboxylate transporter receptor subunit TctC
MRRLVIFVAPLALLGLASAVAIPSLWAQPEPAFPGTTPIEITVLFPAGSSADVSARLLADGMSKRLGVNVIVVDRPGAGGALGYKFVAGQKPDGHSLVWNSNSISTTYYSGTLPFTYREFEPVARVLAESPVVAVPGNSPWKSLGELMAAAKAKPKAITVANSGTGSHTHISSVALFKAANADVVDVPFGAAQLVPALLGGQVDAAVQLPAALAGSVRSGQLRLLASLTAQRDPAFADVPTAREQGFDVALEAWRGIAVPKGTPQSIVARLEAAIRDTVESREFKEGCERIGARPTYAPALTFGDVIAKEDKKLGELMEAIGLNKHSEDARKRAER